MILFAMFAISLIYWDPPGLILFNYENVNEFCYKIGMIVQICQTSFFGNLLHNFSVQKLTSSWNFAVKNLEGHLGQRSNVHTEIYQILEYSCSEINSIWTKKPPFQAD